MALQIGDTTYYYAELSPKDYSEYEWHTNWYPIQNASVLGATFTRGKNHYIKRWTGNTYFPEGLTEGESITISGDIGWAPWLEMSSCEDDDPCIPGVRLQLTAYDNVYYLGTTDSAVGARLDSIAGVLYSVNCICEQPATVTGTIYTYGEHEYIKISSISILGSVQPAGYQPTGDTIPLYIKDGPGSSPVEPVDPNEVVATLTGDRLSVYEYINTEITMTLTPPSSNNLPARAPAGQTETFHDSVTIQLTREGTYSLQLSNPEWDYIIVGVFDYPQSSQSVGRTDADTPVARKILREGQLLLQVSDRIYTVTGMRIQ